MEGATGLANNEPESSTTCRPYSLRVAFRTPGTLSWMSSLFGTKALFVNIHVCAFVP